MITNIRNKVLCESENEFLNSKNISVNDLIQLSKDCPAVFKYKDIDDKSSTANIGLVSHAAILNNESFNDRYLRLTSKNDSIDMITSDAAVKAWLKKQGRLAPKSTMKGAELYDFADSTGDHPLIFNQECLKCEDEAVKQGKTLVKGDDYDAVLAMREVIFNNCFYKNILSKSSCDTFLLCDIEINNEFWVSVKLKADIIIGEYYNHIEYYEEVVNDVLITHSEQLPGYGVIDYKTTSDVSPNVFGKRSYDAFDWLKNAFIVDVLKAFYEKDFRPGILAQQKTSPFIPQLYWLESYQVEIGREQYIQSLKIFNDCSESDIWYSYSDGAMMLDTPNHIKKLYNINQNV